MATFNQRKAVSPTRWRRSKVRRMGQDYRLARQFHNARIARYYAETIRGVGK